MTDINKTIRKIAGNQKNALALYVDEEFIAGAAENFNTVFVYSNSQVVRARNIVYRENFNDMSVLSEIGVVLFAGENLSSLKYLKDLLSKTRAAIILFSPELMDAEHAKLLKNYRYQIVDIRKKFQVWTFKN